MSTKTRQTLLRAAALSLALALLLTTAPAAAAGTRPLVTILATFPYPTAPADLQNKKDSASPYMLIPGAMQPSAAVSDIVTTDVGNGACSSVVSVHVDVQIDHPAPANLTISLSTISRDQRRTFKTTKLFDGPSTGSTTLPTSFDLDYSILDSADCSRWRLTVTDSTPVSIGLFRGWTLTRRTAVFPFAHDKAYYEKLVFGGGSPKLPVNVNDYFQDVSSGKFKFSNEGFYESAWPNWVKSRHLAGSGEDKRPDSFFVADLVHMLEAKGFNFQAYDTDHDGRVSSEELLILAIDNAAQTTGSNRSGPDGGCTTLANSALKVCSRFALVAQQNDFESITHELSHSLGTVDLYGDWGKECLSDHMTLMSCTIGQPDGMRSLRLDPWHRHWLGWLPYQDYGIATYRLGPDYNPAVLRNPANKHEYYIFEDRQPATPWDSGMPSYGVVVWHVRENADGSAYKGSDGKQAEGHFIYAVSLDNPYGGSRAWSPEDGVFQLQWEDKTLLAVSFQLKATAIPGASVILEASPASPNGSLPALSILTPSDNSEVTNGLGHSIQFQAFSSTDIHARIDWFSSVDGHIGTGVSGGITSYAFAAIGPRTITAVARTSSGATSRKSITLNVVAGQPVAVIQAPGDGSTFQRGQPFRLSGNVATPTLFSLDCNSLTWSVNRDPSWSAKGCNAQAQFDFTGAARIFLHATDENKQTASASVAITIIEPAPLGPPIVAITSLPPFNIMPDRPFHISGVVKDPAPCPVGPFCRAGEVTYQWTILDLKTNRETQISTAAEFNWVPQSTVTPYTSFQLRLRGTNKRNGATAEAVQSGYVTDVPR